MNTFHHSHLHTRRDIFLDKLKRAHIDPTHTVEQRSRAVAKRATGADSNDVSFLDKSGATNASPAPSPAYSCGSDGLSRCVYATSDTSTTTLPIALGVVIPVFFFTIAMIVIWRIRKKNQLIEEQNDKHASLDFGLGEVSRKTKAARGAHRSPEMIRISTEKDVRNARGMSMDMGSPYVLPSDLTDSRPSFHSISRSTHDGEDPYRPVTLVRGESSPVGGQSLYTSRPGSRKDSASVWTQSSEGMSGAKSSLIRYAQLPSNNTPPPLSGPEISLSGHIPSPPSGLAVGEPLADHNGRPAEQLLVTTAFDSSNQIFPREQSTATTASSLRQESAVGRLDIALEANLPMLSGPPSPTSRVSRDYTRHAPATPPKDSSRQSSGAQPLRQDSFPALHEHETYANVLGIAQNEVSESRASDASNLGVTGVHSKWRRSSLSMRPLPPDDPEENPETRANRIRSFYREYFDDKLETRFEGGDYGGVDYFEDYNQEHMDSATIIDPASGQFVVGSVPSFAQPITRRAMTPPPRAPPQFRNGSASSHRFYGSGQAGLTPHSRGFSSASMQASRGRAYKRPHAPPPAPLNNLPTPYLLRDDSAIFNAMDFAPPITFRDRQAGRPESPMMDQRPYSPTVRPFTPLASSFDELRAMPSAHSLRKSGTYTGLDFAPPPRLISDGTSDAGSIRSGRSNMSAVQVANIRAGAYRVSRIPTGIVGTKDDFVTSLRPTWEQRGPH